MRTLFGAPMIDRDRAELQIAAVLGAALGVVTGYAIGKPLFGILIWGSLVQSLSAARFIVIGPCASRCPPLVAFPENLQKVTAVTEFLAGICEVALEGE